MMQSRVCDSWIQKKIESNKQIYLFIFFLRNDTAAS